MTEQEAQNLLVRVDERTLSMDQKMVENHAALVKRIEAFIENAERKYVTKDEFLPVKNIVYGMVGVILLSVLGSIISFVSK